MSFVDRNPYVARIEALEEEVEKWRARAEAAEAALQGTAWETPRWPCSLYQTRVLRVLVNQDATGNQIALALENNYPGTSLNVLKAQISKMRRVLPEHIAPPLAYNGGWGNGGPVYTIPDREALRAFLDGGELPAARRAA